MSLHVYKAITAALIVSAATCIYADEIAKYPFTGTTAAARRASTDTQADSTASNFFNGAGITAYHATGIGNPVPSRLAVYSELTNTANGAVVNDDYFSFTATANDGLRLYLTSLAFETSTNNNETNESTTFFLRSNQDGYAANLGSWTQLTNSATFTTRTVDLTGAAFQGISSANFRIYMFDNGATTEAYGPRVDNVLLSGTVGAPVSIPEPASLWLISFAVLGWNCHKTSRGS